MNILKGLRTDRLMDAFRGKEAGRPYLRVLLGMLLLLLSVSVSAEMVNINKADLETLQLLNGIGPVKAAAIVKYRKSHGAFKSVEELKQVPGIGEGILEKNRGNLSLKRGVTHSSQMSKKRTTITGGRDMRHVKGDKKTGNKDRIPKKAKKKIVKSPLVKDEMSPKPKKKLKKKKEAKQLKGQKPKKLKKSKKDKKK